MSKLSSVSCLLRLHLLLGVQALIHFGGIDMLYRMMGAFLVWFILEIWLIKKGI